MSLDRVARERLAAIEQRGTYRRMRQFEGAQAARMRVDGRDVLLFAGSNYLDLAHHPRVVEASAAAAREYGCAAGGSRLITGNLDLHEALEGELADFLGTESALVFSTGYMANVGVISSLMGPGDVVVSDELNHASIIDGCRLARSQVRVFRHNDVGHLEEVLREVCDSERRVLLAVDGIYSMDGDVAPLPRMVELAREHGAIFLLDDAHGTGALGANGRGTLEHLGVSQDIDIHVGTLGKALGSFGAFVAGGALLRDFLVNTARSFIFSCALAPPQVAAARAALTLVIEEPERRTALQRNAQRLRKGLADHGISTEPSTTQIVPVQIGENDRTMALCERLLERGFFAQGIRHPSVPEGTARLRVTPMATHREAEIDAFVEALSSELARLS